MGFFQTMITLAILMFVFMGICWTLQFVSTKKIVNTILDTLRLVLVGFDFLLMISVVEHINF